MGDRRYDALAEARRLVAGAKGFVIATVSECLNPTAILDRKYVDAYVLYRNRVRIGRRRDPGDLLRLIKQTLEKDKVTR